MILELSDRFWSKVDRRGPDECWPWKASLTDSGYGRFYFQGRVHSAHRVSFQAHQRLLADGEFACHHCDNPRCVNPAHLFAGDHKANMADMRAKGRQRYGAYVPGSRRATGDENGARLYPERLFRGEANKNSVLTESQVIEIRSLYSSGGISQRQLSARFGVGVHTMWCLLRGKTWAHAPGATNEKRRRYVRR